MATVLDIDPGCIQPIEHRSKARPVRPDEIPVIDLSDSRVDEVISKIGMACEEWGFFQVINHGVNSELRKKFESVAKKFFLEKSKEEKKKLTRDALNVAGYHDGEHTKDVKDWREIYIYLVEDNAQVPSSYDSNDPQLTTITNRWPQNDPHFRELLQEYAREVEKLAFKILELVSLSLGLPSDKFFDCFKEQLSIVALNHYPAGPYPDLVLGVGPHKDTCAITLLAQDETEGLHVLKSDGEWVPVKPIPNAYTINLGEVFQVWSNDKFKSVEHRAAINTKVGRFSNAFFLNPNRDVMVKPAEELINEENPTIYKGYNFGKFFSSKNCSDFQKRNEENLQIHHFKAEE